MDLHWFIVQIAACSLTVLESTEAYIWTTKKNDYFFHKKCLASPVITGVGRRTIDLKKRTGEVVLCDSCCDTDLCQSNLCSDQAFPSPRGPLCFSCSSMLQDDCNKFEVCGRDQVCYESLMNTGGSGDLVKETGCYGKQTCAAIKLALGKRSGTSHSCINCCSNDLCNNNCTMTTPPRSSVSPGNNGSTVAVPACTDKTAADICKVAAQYLCYDRDKAEHANCLHYCGFC